MLKYLKKTAAAAALALALLPAMSQATLFGYYHATPEGVDTTKNHTNLVHVQAANPLEPLDVIAERHPKARIAFEFSIMDMSLRGANGCSYNKCHTLNVSRAHAILPEVIKLLTPYKNRVEMLMIADEIETNPGSRKALQDLIGIIRSYPELSRYPLLVNYDNTEQGSSGTEFAVEDGIDYVSLTPNYGRKGSNGLLEQGRYSTLLRAARAASPNPKLIVVGDGFGFGPDEKDGRMTPSGIAHQSKIDALHHMAVTMAKEHGIEVAGELVFAYDRHPGYPGEYGVAQAPKVIQEAWKNHALRITGHITTPPPPVPTPPPPVSPPSVTPPPVCRPALEQVWKGPVQGSTLY